MIDPLFDQTLKVSQPTKGTAPSKYTAVKRFLKTKATFNLFTSTALLKITLPQKNAEKKPVVENDTTKLDILGNKPSALDKKL